MDQWTTMTGHGSKKLAEALSDFCRQNPSALKMYKGRVLAAGGGQLRVRVSRLALEKTDLWVNPQLNWRWTEDTGGPDLLRSGDRVVLLTQDGQEYILLCKVVRP